MAASLVAGCVKKKDVLQPVYTPPAVEWPDDEELDDLPEAGETDTGDKR
jgi:hypothetical protein